MGALYCSTKSHAVATRSICGRPNCTRNDGAVLFQNTTCGEIGERCAYILGIILLARIFVVDFSGRVVPAPALARRLVCGHPALAGPQIFSRSRALHSRLGNFGPTRSPVKMWDTVEFRRVPPTDLESLWPKAGGHSHQEGINKREGLEFLA